MSNRHSSGVAVQWRITRPALAALSVVVFALIVVTIMGVKHFSATTASAQICGPVVNIEVAADKAMVPALTVQAERWNKISFIQNGKCLRAHVHEASSATEAALLATSSADHPSIWIPGSTYWVSQLQNALSTRGLDGHITKLTPHTATASSPLVLVASPQRAAALEAAGGVKWSTILTSGAPVLLDNPLTSSEGLVSLVAIRQALGGSAPFDAMVSQFAGTALPSAQAGFDALLANADTPIFVATEQQIIAANAAHKSNFATALYPADGTLSLSYPAVRLDYVGDDPVLAAAADGFLGSFEATARSNVTNIGLRDVDGNGKQITGGESTNVGLAFVNAPAPPPNAERDVTQSWLKNGPAPHVLAALDISSLMRDPLPDGERKIDAQYSAAISFASAYLSDSAQFGIWAYSTKLTQTTDWIEKVSLGNLGETINGEPRRTAVEALPPGINTPEANNGAALYDTTLNAFYAVKHNYANGQRNAVVVMTGSANRDPAGVTLDQLLSTLRDQQDPQHPIEVITIGIGDGADNTALTAIAAATQGKSYVAANSVEALEDLATEFAQPTHS